MSSKQKPKLLIIAPSLPYYNHSSGGRRLFSILEMLSMEYKIIYLSINKNLYSNKVNYNAELRRLGVDVYERIFNLKNIIQNNMFSATFLEFYYIAEYYLPRLRILMPSCPIIVDSVDLHYHREFLNYSITGDMNVLETAMRIKRKELSVYKRSDLVIAVSDRDAKIIKDDSPDVHLEVIPNIHRVCAEERMGLDKNALVFIGGFYHKPNVDAVIYFCKEILPILVTKMPEIYLTIIGSDIPREVRQLASQNVKVLGYVPSVFPYLQKSYISVAPLRYGAGMKGKVGEAMACGIPVVTTSVGIQGMNVINRKDIMIGDTPENFAQAIIELIDDSVLYNKLSINSKKYVENNLAPEIIFPEIIRIFRGVRSASAKTMSLNERLAFFASYVYEKSKSLNLMSILPDLSRGGLCRR